MKKYLKLIGGKIMGKKFLSAFLFAVLLLTLPLSAQASLVSMLNFDGNFTDTTGKIWTNYDVTLSSSKSISGGSSAYFNENLAFLEVNDPNLFNFGSSSFTIDFWMNPSSLRGHVYLAGRSYPDAGLGYDLRSISDHIIVQGVNGWYNPSLNALNVLEIDKWYHVMLSVSTDTASLYVDGLLKGQTPRSIISDDGNPFRIGWTSGISFANSFHGYIDEFKIYNEALSPNTSPVPVPTTIFLLGSGVLGLAGVSRRKNSQNL